MQTTTMQTTTTTCLAPLPRRCRPPAAARVIKERIRNSSRGCCGTGASRRAKVVAFSSLCDDDDDDDGEESNNNDDTTKATTTTTTTTNDCARRRRTMVLALAVASTVATGCGNPKLQSARAIQSEIELRDLKYEATECPPNQYIPSKKSAMCVEFTATATSKKNVSAANVFGFVDDYDGNSAATNNDTGTSRVVLSQIDRPIPEGTSEVKFVVTVFKDSYKKGAFKLRGFKAIEANAAINKRFVPLGDCDLDPAAPGCPNDPNA